MMSYIPDDATCQRLLRQLQQKFPGLPSHMVLAVLHENKYDPERAHATLVAHHLQLTGHASQASVPRPSYQHSRSSQYPAQPMNHPSYYRQPYPNNYYHQQQYPQSSLHHSQSDSAIRPSSSYSSYYSNQRDNTAFPPHTGYNYRQPNFNNPSAQYYGYQQTGFPHVSSATSFTNTGREGYAATAGSQSPRSYRQTRPDQQLFVDVSGQSGRQYATVDQALVTGPVPHTPLQCTDPHPASLQAESAVSPIDMRVPQLPFPALQPAQSPRSGSPASTDQSRSRTNSHDEGAYASALILQQRARMTKLHKHLIDRKQYLDQLSNEVLDKETKLLRRNNERQKPAETAKMAETNRKLQVQIQLMLQEIDHYNSGAAPLGVVDPRSHDNFHKSMTELGQAGPMRLPDNTPVHISGANPYAGPHELDEGDSWDCSYCTFLNHPALTRCEECEMPKTTRLPSK